jgi:hypothetical protein
LIATASSVRFSGWGDPWQLTIPDANIANEKLLNGLDIDIPGIIVAQRTIADLHLRRKERAYYRGCACGGRHNMIKNRSYQEQTVMTGSLDASGRIGASCIG